MELSILCDCEVALIIVSGGKKVFPYVSTDMAKTLAKYHELADTGHLLTNADYEILNARSHDTPLPSSRPQRTRSHSNNYAYEDEFYDDSEEDEPDEFALLEKMKRGNGKRASSGDDLSPLPPKRRVTLKMGADPAAAAPSANPPLSSSSEASPSPPPATDSPQQFSASGRPLRRSLLREPNNSTPQPTPPQSAFPQTGGSAGKEYDNNSADMGAAAGATAAPNAAFQSGSHLHGMPSQLSLLQQSPQASLPTGAELFFPGGRAPLPYVYPGYNLNIPYGAYPSPYMAGQQMPNPGTNPLGANFFAQPIAPAGASQQSSGPLAAGASALANATSNAATPGSATNSGNNSTSESPAKTPGKSSSLMRNSAPGLSVMVPDSIKRTSLISPLTPTLGSSLAGTLPLLHSPTIGSIGHSAFFPTLPSPSPTTAPSAFGAIFPPFSGDFSLMNHTVPSLASAISNASQNALGMNASLVNGNNGNNNGNSIARNQTSNAEGSSVGSKSS